MFHSGSGTRYARHRLRTTAQCLWLCIRLHRTLQGSRYRVKLSIDPGFLQVPVSPAFALIPSRLATCSNAFQCSKRCALSVRPIGGTIYPLSLAIRSHEHFLSCAVSWSPNIVSGAPALAGRSVCSERGLEIGSKGGVAPPSAHRSRTSPIRGMRLQRLLG